MNEKIIRRTIIQELKCLQYNFSYLGTRYIIDAIILLYSRDIYYNFSLEGNVYPIIANKYQSNTNAIKGAIVYATDKMFFDCDEKYLKKYLNLDEYFDNEYDNLKPGPKEIIRAILKKIKDI